jgi:hypothetical protein
MSSAPASAASRRAPQLVEEHACAGASDMRRPPRCADMARRQRSAGDVLCARSVRRHQVQIGRYERRNSRRATSRKGTIR